MPLEHDEAMELLLDRVGQAATNAEFLDSMNIVDE